MQNIGYLLLLVIADILIFAVYAYVKNKQKKNQLVALFGLILVLLIIWCTGLIFQILAVNFTEIPPIVFEYIVYISTCFLPVAFFYFGLAFAQTKIQFKKWHAWLLVIPILSLVMLWTNDLHHLFYVNYSTSTADTVFGNYFYIHSLYTFVLFAISIVYFLRFSLKTSGFFSKQSFFIIIGAMVPLVLNLIGLFGVPMSIYLTPVSFAITILSFALAIFKFDFMRVTPIAIQKIVDIMSDGYIVLNADNIITDFNKTFLDMFNFSSQDVRGKDLFKLSKDAHSLFGDDEKGLKKHIKQIRNSDKTYLFEKKFEDINRYFNIEITSINTNNDSVGTLILFKDTTQHMLDMETIQNNQQMLMERERLASLGQLIGGIAHNLKTPIMSISGASEGLIDLVKEYDASVGDSEVTLEDHHAIAKDMSEWIEKIKTHTEYMSDVITAVKGQAVTLSEEQNVSFDVDELVKRVNILMRHEIKNALVNFNVLVKTRNNLTLHGNIVSLVQVINNMISNSIQAYNGEPGKDINLIVSKKGNNLIISIQDFAGGLPKEVQDKLFKEMITTKGKNGTGLGLFMSYSTIRAHFNGNISFETKSGKGTTFNISLPIQ